MNIQKFCKLGDHTIFNSGLLIFNAKEFKKMKDYTDLYTFIIINCLNAISISKKNYNVNNYIIVVDLKDTNKSNIDLTFFKSVVVKLQEELPAVLNKCIFLNSSKLFKCIYDIISIFINSVTKKKINFSKETCIENIKI